MASFSFRLKLLLIIISMLLLSSCVKADSPISFQLMNEALEWPWTMSVYDHLDLGGAADEEPEGRRSLYYRSKARHYYISYGALSANRIPCPPRSGRSYYSHNCFRATGSVNPYTRGCSRITHCRR